MGHIAPFWAHNLMSADVDEPLDLTEELGAVPALHQVLVLFIPDRDRNGLELGDQRKWVLEAAQLLARIGGGVSIEPPIEGGWLDEERGGNIVWERPVRVFTYVRPECFQERLGELREFLHRIGRRTLQGEVAIEFAGQFCRIRSFDDDQEH
jgi:hypothetical protein